MEIITGGSMIMPIDMRVEATTKSIIINGIYKYIPILNATVNSLRINAGISMYVGTSARVFGFSSPRMDMKSRIFSGLDSICRYMNRRRGASPAR
jgi:hypothetical protein